MNNPCNPVKSLLLNFLVLLFKTIYILVIKPFVKLSPFFFGDYFRELDRKHRIKEDFYIIPYFFKSVYLYALSVKKRRFQTWYLFVEQVAKNGDHPAIRYTRPVNVDGKFSKTEFELEAYTYRELYDISLRLSYILTTEYNVGPGDYIAIDCTNKPLFLFLWYALWNIGAIPAFLNYNTLGHSLVHSLEISKIQQVFIDPDASQPIRESESLIYERLPEIKLNYLDEPNLMKRLLDTNSPSFLQSDEQRCPRGLTDFKPSMLIYTSGTTGLPKSAIMSWRKSGVGTQLFGWVLHMDNQSVVFTAMPLFHSTAALLGVCAVMSQGGCIAIAPKFSASQFWKQVCLVKATHVQYVGELCRYLLHTPKTEYETKHCAKVAFGNGLRPDIWQDFRKRFNIEVIGEFYAATEAPFATTTFQRGDFGVGACRSYGSIIQWFLSFQQVLVKMDPNDDSAIYRNEKGYCERAGVNEPGEMLMRIFFPRKPETSFQGYLGNKKATKSKVVRDVFWKGDAWYRCGDLFREDENGLWYFLDRLGDTFRWKSENVSTFEVEDQIIISNPTEFSQVLVVGIKIPKYEGRCGFAVIKLKQDVDFLPEEIKLALLDKMLRHLRKALPKYALPIFVKFVNNIKMTDTNKILKKYYRDQKLPFGEDGNDVLYWLEGYKKYKRLTREDWDKIEDQTVKL